MRLTAEDLNKIRPLQWVIRDVVGSGKPYYTVVGGTSTRLFWVDFLRNVFAPRFAKQLGVTRIGSFDFNTPVMLGFDMNLRLPSLMETAMHYADNLEVRTFQWKSPSSFTTLIIAIVSLLVLLLLSNIKGAEESDAISNRMMLDNFLSKSSKLLNARIL